MLAYSLILAFILTIYLILNLNKNDGKNVYVTQSKKYGMTSLTKSGRKVRSKGEKRIADWLTARGIRYVYEHKLTMYTPDFFLPDFKLIIEYYGLREAPGFLGKNYRQKILDKRRYFDSLSVNYLELYQEDLSRLDHIILPLLRKKRTF